jgi:cell division protein FtsZ
MQTENKLPSVQNPKPLSGKIIGLGGAGLQAADYMAQTDLGELSFAAVHTDSRALANSSAGEKMLLGANLMRGLGAGGDPELGQAAAEEDFPKLKALCAGADLVFILAGLGGGTATGAAPVLARAARETGALVLPIATLPFEFEGQRRQHQARLGLQQLKMSSDGVLCLPNQKLVKLLGEDARALEVLNLTHELLAQGVRGLWQMLTRNGLANVEFADLASMLRGRHWESSFACAQAIGENRAQVVFEKLLSSPLLDEGKQLPDAEAILVSVMGGSDLTMADVNGVLQRIQQQAEKAQLVTGAAIDDQFQGQLAVTIVVSRRSPLTPEESATVSRLSHRVGSADEAAGPEIENQFFGAPARQRPAFRFVPPPPELTAEQTKRLLAQRGGSSSRRHKVVSNWLQGQLPLEIISKGRFDKSEPTLHDGEDLDVPTYIRRGVSLN